VAADNSIFASVGGDKLVFLWDVSTAKTIRRFEGHWARINAVGFNSDASVIASGSYDATVRLWDVKSQSRKPIQTLEEAGDSVSSIDVAGHEIVVGSVDGKVRNYDIRMGRCFVDIIGFPVTSVAQSTDGNAVLVSSLDGSIRLMDKINGQMLQSYKGHTNKDFRVRSCFGDKDKYVVSGSEDGMIWVYDLLEGNVVHKMSAHGGKVISSVAYNPAGKKQMLSAGVDGMNLVFKKRPKEY
jgi:mitogen-activated protein kinase organizer 1